MKFDLLAWKEKKNAQGKILGPVLRVRSSVAGALYLSGHDADGVVAEALVGVGTEFDVEAPGALTWRLDVPKAARVFVHEVEPSAMTFAGEVFTNIDRMPDESGTVAEVLRAQRLFKLEQQAMLREMREAARALRQPEAEPAPAPALDPAPAAAAPEGGAV